MLLALNANPSAGNEQNVPARTRANLYVKMNKLPQALDEFATASGEFKNEHAELSIHAFTLYRDYERALRLAGLKDEADALSKALTTHDALIKSYAAEVNNEAVTMLNASNFTGAISKLNQSLKLDPSNNAAKKYLVTAYNNAGLQYGVKQPLEAILLFRRGLIVDPDSKIMRSNLNSLLQVLGKNPADFNQRVTMGDGLLKTGESVGAFVEYAEALRLKEDPSVRAKMEAVPKNEAIFSYQLGKSNPTETATKVTTKAVQKPAAKPTEHKRQNVVHVTLDSGIASLRAFFEQKTKQEKVDELLKQSTSIETISRANDILPGSRVKECFNAAVKALGKNPESPDDLFELAQEEKKSGNYQSTIFVLNQAPNQDSTSDSFKTLRRSANALLLAQQISNSQKSQPLNPSPYKLFARKSNLRSTLQMSYSLKDRLKLMEIPAMPESVDLEKFMDPEPPPEVADEKILDGKTEQSKQIGALGGMDDGIPAGVNADTELNNLSNLINKDSDNDALRIKQSVLLVQYGNSILKSGGNAQTAANKYREALYILPANTEASNKLNACLSKQGIDPKKPSERFKQFIALYDDGLKEASLAELREFSQLSKDGPSQALLGACELEDSTESTEGYLNLLFSLNKNWDTGSDSAKSMVHVIIGELLQRDAERALTAVDKNRRLKDLQKISLHLKQAALLDRSNSQAINKLLEVSKEAARINNSAGNNLFLAGAYFLQGNKDGARGSFASAVSLAPRDPVFEEAYEKFKGLDLK